MLIDLDKFQIMYYLEGCARGSHLRQGCWHDMIKLYPKMNQNMRDFLYTYSKRDIAPYFELTYSDGFHPVGAEDFFQFLACFNKDNRYMVTAQEGKKEEKKEAYLYNGKYYTSDVYYFDEEFIKKVEKI